MPTKCPSLVAHLERAEVVVVAVWWLSIQWPWCESGRRKAT